MHPRFIMPNSPNKKMPWNLQYKNSDKDKHDIGVQETQDSNKEIHKFRSYLRLYIYLSRIYHIYKL